MPIGKSVGRKMPLGVQFVATVFNDNETLLITMANELGDKAFGGWVASGNAPKKIA